MTTPLRLAAIIILGCCALPALSQSVVRAAHIGYVYPAGAKRGTTAYVTVGGQFLRGASDVCITGDGIRAKVVKEFQPVRAIGADERAALAEWLRGLFLARWEELIDSGKVDSPLPRGLLRHFGLRSRKPNSDDDREIKLPEHPLLHDLEHKSFRELCHAVHSFRNLFGEQRNQQLGHTVLVEIEIDRNATPGDRELRLETRLGLTNPLCFQVGAYSDTYDLETGDIRLADYLPEEPAAKLPVTFNGQILPGDVDTVRFEAVRGQQLVIEAHARRLVPYLADAVPGWFQATLTLYNAAGEKLAFADDYRFSPDPVLRYDVLADGVYTLEVRDAIYRGREDFVYRIDIGEKPFVTSVFPLGCRVGQKRYVSVDGWNLATDRLFIDGKTNDVGVWERPLGAGRRTSNPVAYHVSPLPATQEEESNDTLASAQALRLPRIVDGRIGEPGDIDMFRFSGRANDEIVVEVIARRVRSPLDGLVRLIDAQGEVVAWNDDSSQKEGFLHTDMGTLTHHADSYLRTRLPVDGEYCVQISDARSHGGPAYAYRLRVGAPQPDFQLRMVPASISVRPGLATPLRVYALRQDGFEGEIELVLQDAPRGFTLSGAMIPAGHDSVRFTLNAPVRRMKKPATLVLEGRATVGRQTITRRVIPSEDQMQAFLYRHLTPAEECVVMMLGGRRAGQPIRVLNKERVQVSHGGAAEVHVQAPRHAKMQSVILELSDPPPGISLQNIAPTSRGFSFELAAERDVNLIGYADNIIVEAFVDITVPARDGRPEQTRRVAVGVLPAIPFEVVR